MADSPSRPLSDAEAPRLRYLRRFPIDGVQTSIEAPIAERKGSSLSHLSVSPPSSPQQGHTNPWQSREASSASLPGSTRGTQHQQPANKSFDPGTFLKDAARAVATAVGETSLTGPSSQTQKQPDASLLSSTELKALQSARAASLRNVDWKNLAGVRQRYFYTGSAYKEEEAPAAASPPPPAPPPPPPEQPPQASPMSGWLASIADGSGWSKRASTLEGQQQQQQQRSQQPIYIPHGTGTLIWIVYGKVKTQRATANGDASSAHASQNSSPPTLSLASAAFISPAVVPTHLCPVEELMPGCLLPFPPSLTGDTAPSTTATAVATAGSGPYAILTVAVYDGGFTHGAFHGSGRLTVFHRYVLECQWSQGVPLLTECCYSGAPCVLRSIVAHRATPLAGQRKAAARQRDGLGDEDAPPASSFLSFKKRSLGHSFWHAESEDDDDDGDDDDDDDAEQGRWQRQRSPRFLSTVVLGNQYMGSLTVSMTVAATTTPMHLLSNPLLLSLRRRQGLLQQEPQDTAAGGGGAIPKANPVESVLRSHWRDSGRLFWTELMSFVPDGFGEMWFTGVDSSAPCKAMSSAASPFLAGGARAGKLGDGDGGGMSEGSCTGRYYGDWRSGYRHGFGADWERASGTLYVGVYSRGLRSGAGTVEVDATGATFSGSWLKGAMKPPANIALSTTSPAFSLQGTQWLPPGAKPSTHSGRKSVTNAEPTSSATFFAFDQGTLLKSRHSASGLWEPLFVELDAALAAMPPVAEELLCFQKRKNAAGTNEEDRNRRAAADDDDGEGQGNTAAASSNTRNNARQGTASREPMVSPQLDPIVLAVTARPEWRAALATFQRTFYFLYGRCPGGRRRPPAAEAMASRVAADTLLSRLQERGRRTGIASSLLATTTTATPLHYTSAEAWSTPSWCSLVGLLPQRIPPCLHSSEPTTTAAAGVAAGTAPEIHVASFTSAIAATAAADTPTISREKDRKLHFPRPCLHALLMPVSTDKSRTSIHTCMSLAHQRGLTSARTFELALHAVASFVSSLRLRLVSYIAAHPAACEVSDHQTSLLRHCWDVVYTAVAPLLHALANAMVADNGGQGNGKGQQSTLLESLGSGKATGAASAFYSFATAHEGGLDGLYTAFEQCLASGNGLDTLTPEEEQLSQTCARLFSCPPLAPAAFCLRATSQGPLMGLADPDDGRDHTASLGTALDALTALVHQTVLRQPASALWQQRRLASCLLHAARLVSQRGATHLPPRLHFRDVGFNPLSTLVLLHGATSAVSPALPIPGVTQLLTQELNALSAAADPAHGKETSFVTTAAATLATPALPAIAQALLRISHTRPGAATPLHELAARCLFCLLPSGARRCRQSYLPNPPPSFTESSHNRVGDSTRRGNTAATVILTSDIAALALYLPSETALSAVQQSIRDALGLTVPQMTRGNAELLSLCDPHSRGSASGPLLPAIPKGSFAASHLVGAFAARSKTREDPGALSVASTSPSGWHRKRHHGGGGGTEVPELVEWILSSVHELFFPRKMGERKTPAQEPSEKGPVLQTWRTFLYGAQQPQQQQQASHVRASYPALMAEDTFWYVQLLSCFLQSEFGIDLHVEVSFGFGDGDGDEDEAGGEREAHEDGRGRSKASKARFTTSPISSSSRTDGNGGSPFPSPEAELVDVDNSNASTAPSPRKLSQRGESDDEQQEGQAEVQLSPTPSPPSASADNNERVIELSPTPVPCTPTSASLPAVAGQQSADTRYKSIVGREVKMTARLPSGFAGGLDWELLADRWTTAVCSLAAMTDGN